MTAKFELVSKNSLEEECYAKREGPTVTVGDKPDPEHPRPQR